MRHPIGDFPARRWLIIRIAENVVHSWDLATAIGVDLGLDEQLVGIAYEYFGPRARDGALYTTGLFAAPTRPLPQDATPLEQLVHLAGR